LLRRRESITAHPGGLSHHVPALKKRGGFHSPTLGAEVEPKFVKQKGRGEAELREGKYFLNRKSSPAGHFLQGDRNRINSGA